MADSGKVYLTGAGPGDPGLITVKAAGALGEADCVLYDLLCNEALLGYAAESAEKIFVGKEGGKETIAQREINAILLKKAREGKTVVRLKGGDPFLFGRGSVEAEWLVKNGIPFEIIPGVSAAVAVPAYAGIPVTHPRLSSSVSVISGHRDALKNKTKEDWRSLAGASATLIILMGRRNISEIAARLIEHGKAPETLAALIASGTMNSQRVVSGTLAELPELGKTHKLSSPLIIAIGDVVGLRERLNWFESKPLFGKRVIVTRTLEQAGTFIDRLNLRGAEAVPFPTIKIVPPNGYKEADRAIKRLSGYDWLIFTSVNGVKYFFKRLYALGLDVRELKGVKICAIGPMTAKAVEAWNIGVDLTPKEFVAEGLLRSLGAEGIKGKRFLLPRALKARELIPEEIKRLGGEIDVVPVYRTVAPRKDAAAIRAELTEGLIDAVTFTSSSTVTNFSRIFGKKRFSELLAGCKIACIGPVTARTASELGLKVDIIAKRYTIEGLTREMEAFYSNKSIRKEP